MGFYIINILYAVTILCFL